MKVDKAVCTNDTLDDHLTKAIKYDVVFTTLVENKILAIKRECEERKRAKKEKRKSLGRMIFGRRLFRGGCSSKRAQANDDVDVEKGESSFARSDEKSISAQGSNAGSTGVSCSKAQSIRSGKEDFESEADESSISLRIPFPIDNQAEDSNGSNENGSLSERGGARDLVVEVLTHRDGHSYDDSEKDELKDNEKGSLALLSDHSRHDATSMASSVRATEKDISIIVDDSFASPKGSIDSLSCASSRATTSAVFPTTRSSEKDLLRLRILEAKSISAQCSPVLPRQKPPSIPTHSICRAPTSQGKLQSQVSYSDEAHNGGGDGGANHQSSSQRNVNTCFSRQNTSEDSANLTISTFVNEQDSIVCSREGRTGRARGTGEWDERKSKSTSILVVTDKSSRKAINHLDSNSIGSYQSNNLNIMRGLISSFNQLTTLTSTTTSNYFPVITTTVSNSQIGKYPATISAAAAPLDGSHNAHISALDDTSAPMDAIIVPTVTVPSDTAKLQRMTSTSTGSSVVPTGCCTTKSSSKEKDKQRFKMPDWETGHSGSDDEYRKRKRKYKRYHRCSDPVLVYPSPGGLQHCILSMPPNQPIQFHYNDDFVYDMTLQVEADQNGDLQAIVPSHRSRHRHHRRHKKRHRHKKPKILVHDLDTQSVKVIDPDDLPQRARWTIIATACLLLIMCLMLVGITLRMAPIIDDMVRQENERLMQESMNRVRLSKNLTEAASLAAIEEIP
ncbi:uncharacterized protein LOC119661355 [Hermetia illucens]|uniref:uncharacterized protein LOC119661355 n=1 Tax=Hermetia illucens TaxID=343691 RepID=UPI0018CC27A9|nr:uncharacterized protein LOC119661355 [Hermetia illucens]